MAKSRAEIQKAYRERVKAKNKEAYLKKERERRRKNYVPSCQLSRRDRIRRNTKNNEILKRHRQRVRERVRAEEAARNIDQNQEIMDTSGYESLGTQNDLPGGLIVRMPFRRNGPRKRIGRALSKKSRELTKLKTDYVTLQRKYKTTLRRLQRMKQKEIRKEPSTPKSKTNLQIREVGLHAEQARTIRKHLLMSNALIEEVKMAKELNNPGKSKILRNVIAGRILKKYRCISTLSRKVGLDRKRLALANTKCFDFAKQKRSREVKRYQHAVINFLERDDNSRNLPGKADKIKTGVHASTQTRVLTDYLSNLHAKFISENPTVKLSLASFQRIRPKHIRITAFITRDSCLCTKHQNMALTLKALRLEGVLVPINPEKYLENASMENISKEISKPEVSFEEWKRVAVEEKGKKKMVMKIVKVVKAKGDFMSHLESQTREFGSHVSRMKTQYEQIRVLKEKLPPHHVVVHMDFSENYCCKTMEEVQSAYWNQQAVTLHPIVIYTRPAEDVPVQHKSFVVVSDDLNHNATAVITYVKALLKEIKAVDPDVECLHYWTDGPTSQYRNKTIFNFVANHESTTGIKAWWNFFEAGHGKGPCDGLGGSTKRMADEAMKSGKVVIQDASDFFAWTQSPTCSMKNVKFMFVPKEVCESTGKELETLPIKAVKGTMKIHAVIGQGSQKILVREVSCYCNDCIDGRPCESWRVESTSVEKNVPEKDLGTENTAIDTAQTETCSGDDMSYSIDEFVVAKYESRWYIGKIIDEDPDDENGYIYQISFMEKRKNMFQWPMNKDILWCRKTDIAFNLEPPIPSGKSGRMYKLKTDDWTKYCEIAEM